MTLLQCGECGKEIGELFVDYKFCSDSCKTISGLRAEIKALEEKLNRVTLTGNYICNCGNVSKQTSAGCPIHGVIY